MEQWTETQAAEYIVGKTIKSVDADGEWVELTFTDGSKVDFWGDDNAYISGITLPDGTAINIID